MISAFIADVVIFAKSAEEHLRQLESILKPFMAKNISISPQESWIGYPSAQILVSDGRQSPSLLRSQIVAYYRQ
ncbi:hypothetical protein ACHAP8_009517 [Fusarium lateritium]